MARGGLPGLSTRARNTIMGLAPVLCIVLFFTTRSWLWFLLIPVVGVVLYGPRGDGGAE